MPRLAETSCAATVFIDSNGRLTASAGYENSLVLANNRWITWADIKAMLYGSTDPWIRWSAGQNIIAPIANPTDSPACYQQRIYIPAAMTLTHYQYGLRGPGTAADGALWVSLWSEVAGALGTEYTDARAMGLHDGLLSGCQSLYCGDGVDLCVHKTVTLPVGWVRLLCTVDTCSVFGITHPNVDYFDAGEVQCVDRGGVAVVTGGGGFGAATDYSTNPYRYSPAVYLCGTAL